MSMTAWRSGGLKGDALESLIEETHLQFKRQGLGIVEKVPTSVKVTKIDNKGCVCEGYFEKKSTVDFVGLIQGIGVAFDAKETMNPSLPLQNIHDHQIEFMIHYEKQKGLAFIICHYKKVDRYFLIPIHIILEHIRSGKKSISYKAIPEIFELKYQYNGLLNYIPVLNSYRKWKKEIKIRNDQNFIS
jgi:recombination protein U